MRPTSFIRRLGPHHFAHLRAVAEGIPLVDSARRYLGIEHGHQATAAHQQTVDLVRSIARRQGNSAWRLIGVLLQTPTANDRPALAEFVMEKSLQDWSEAEQIEFYEAAHPVDSSSLAKAQRHQRLRLKQLQALRSLEVTNAEQPKSEDIVSGWFDERTAAKLIGAGYLQLAQLQQAIHIGGRWYASLPGIGQNKAQRIAAHLQTLLPTNVPARIFSTPAALALIDISASLPEETLAIAQYRESLAARKIATQQAAGSNVLPSLIHATSDADAVRIWVQTHAGSAATVKSFWREAKVFLLWLQLERQQLRFADLKVDDCLAFKAFLENIPAHWISRKRARPGQLGWAPFRGPLSETSRHHLLNIVGALFAYFKLANYILQNPWPLIKTRVAMKKTASNSLDTRAFSAQAQSHIAQFIKACPASRAQARMLFIVNFLATVGLRASELLAAKLEDIRHTSYGYALEVIGKAGKHRVVALPSAAINAINAYLPSRGWSDLSAAPPSAPLLASVKDPMASISYQALYLTVRTWMGKAIEQASLPEVEKRSLRGASTHWLRHTFATRAIEREVPMEVVQAQLGHASINTTMNIYAKASLQRQLSGIAVAFE